MLIFLHVITYKAVNQDTYPIREDILWSLALKVDKTSVVRRVS